jgi:uncharacterized oxidoreductase
LPSVLARLAARCPDGLCILLVQAVDLTAPSGAGPVMPTLSSDTLHALSRTLCAAGGSLEHEATLVADHLVEANLTGHDSHGVGLLPIYLENVEAGRLVPNRHADLVSERGVVLAIEGNRGYAR